MIGKRQMQMYFSYSNRATTVLAAMLMYNHMLSYI